jgi:hypothetical protein
MTGVVSRLADAVSQRLDPEEREAVWGDLEESGASATSRLCEVLGLVVRRQAEQWADWRPWLGLFGVAIPTGALLSFISRNWSDVMAIDSYVYATHWTSYIFRSPGARLDLVGVVLRFLMMSIALMGWAWSAGSALGSISRRTTWVSGAAFTILIFTATWGTTTVARVNPLSASVFTTSLGVVLPHVVRIDLVVLPALWGMRNGSRLPSLPRRSAIAWAVVIAALALWAAPGLAASFTFGRLPADYVWPGTRIFTKSRWPVWLLPSVLSWPAVYMVATSIRRVRFQRNR